MSYLDCPHDCGNVPTLDTSWPDSALNWLRESTPDQRRIEDVLAKYVKPDSRILHVGVGNSELAVRFHRFVGYIDGVTMGRGELVRATDLNLQGYNLYHSNKYSASFQYAIRFNRKYDFIVDNNLGSYACCRKHFLNYIDTCARRLKDGGMILTDKAGLAHAPGDSNWNLVDDIERLADKFNLTLKAETEMVYALKK